MTLATRIEKVEDHNLTPREAVILWMREAHAFDSLLDYGRWLMDQPDEAYPLIRMPAQVVAAVRNQNKGQRDEFLRDEFYQVQRDVLFLYHLHKQVNMRALQDEEALRLKLALLAQSLRALIHRVWAFDSARLDHFEFPEDLSKPLPRRKGRKSEEELELEEALSAWPREEQMLWGEVTAFREAVGLISRRYLGGEELLYPNSAQGIEVTLSNLAELRDIYHSVTSHRPPESDEGFLRWMLEESGDRITVSPSASPLPALEKRPDTSAAARSLAEHFILMAKAEALETLGDQNGGIRLVEKWLREEAGWESRGR